MSSAEPAGKGWWFVVAAVATLGCLLRYHDISHQILLDDEWHALRYASVETAARLATHYVARATSIPVNIYERLALMTVGWSEVSVRLLSILATAATLVALPAMIYRVFESRVMGVVAAVLFAASPFWVFYGMSSRPYAAYLLFLTATYYFFERALRARATSGFAYEPIRPWLAFAICGALAAYFHFFAAPAVASLAVVLLVAVGTSPRSRLRTTLVPAAAGFVLFALLMAVFYVVPVLNAKREDIPTGYTAPEIGADFFRNAAELLTGSRFHEVTRVLVACAVVGLVCAFRRNRLFTCMLLAGTTAQVVAVLVLKPRQFYLPLVMLRYCISFFLVYLTGWCALVHEVAVFAARRTATSRRLRIRWLMPSIGLAALALLIGVTPIPRALASRPNNFRMHSAFQESYENWDTNRMYRTQFHPRRRQRSGVPEFYTELERAGKPCRLIEYPLPIEDEWNPFYFYQYHHGCEVLAGYSAQTFLGEYLDVEHNRERLRFNQLIGIDDMRLVRATGAEYLVVHLELYSEVEGRKPDSTDTEVVRILDLAEKEFGSPTYRDRWLRVFSLQRAR